MKPKLKNMEMHKLFCLSNLLLENLDTLNATTPKMIKYREDLIGLCEEINRNVEDTYTIQKSTYFQDISNKIDAVLRNNFNENM
jgi:hypothetical protein|tara:strand:+ start:35 stop:286 length:252 start_codon:yes stop_codon:yes gene_type:complete